MIGLFQMTEVLQKIKMHHYPISLRRLDGQTGKKREIEDSFHPVDSFL